MSDFDTIAAISTPPGEGGVGIIRVSGPEALKTALKTFSFFKAPGDIKERRMYCGSVMGPGEEVIDKGLFVYMKSPLSYTGEDVVELHCHGGSLILRKALEALTKAGARTAGPGEFTRRAFLNGKIDLAQAEAVIDMIRASTEALLSSARARLEGAFSKKVNAIKQGLLGLVAHMEAELDFPEDEMEGLPESHVFDALFTAGRDIERLISSYEEGKVIREGVRALILGRPNVGKSSLLNILLKEERAIVTPLPGTTRDIIEEVINVKGIPVRLMDTAGLRETADGVEAIGVARARQRIRDAGLILFVVDASADRFEEDQRLLLEMEGKKVLIVANKTDLAGQQGIEDLKKAFGDGTILISALNMTGIEELDLAIHEAALGHSKGSMETLPGETVVSVRHRDCLEKALEGVRRAEEAMRRGLPREMMATDLRWSLDRLGEITGETTTEDILDKIFEEFCIGK